MSTSGCRVGRTNALPIKPQLSHSSSPLGRTNEVSVPTRQSGPVSAPIPSGPLWNLHLPTMAHNETYTCTRMRPTHTHTHRSGRIRPTYARVHTAQFKTYVHSQSHHVPTPASRLAEPHFPYPHQVCTHCPGPTACAPPPGQGQGLSKILTSSPLVTQSSRLQS